VLRVRQQDGVSVRHVKSLQVEGDERADFDLFSADFGKNDGTQTDDDLEAEYLKLKPFFRLSWIAFPATQQGIDPNDEKFIQFAIARSMGAIIFQGKDRKDSYGFESTKQEPKYLMTSPVWSQLVLFTQTDPGTMTGIYPVLRDEAKAGRVKLRVDLDGELINVPVREIKFPWAVSLSEAALREMSPQDLFYGIDRGERENLPRGKDSLVPAR
jgi:hypothetical protein